MIRKAVIVVLTLGAVGTSAIWITMVLTAGGMSVRFRQPWLWGYSDQSVILGTYNPPAGATIPTLPAQPFPNGILGFNRYEESWIGAGFTAWYIPYWLVVLFFVAYPTLAFIRGPLRRWRRRRKGLCVKCTYNLTGNISGVCPECGSKI